MKKIIIDQQYYRTFLWLSVGLPNDEDVSELENITERVNGIVKECTMSGITKIVVEFYPKYEKNGWPFGFVILLSDCFQKVGGKIAIIEKEEKLREKWQHLIHPFGITIISSMEEIDNK